ncbi:MAG TPA: TonB-dependent receptor [Pedobacter sp.]|nr:TonB-dependent receptor [Pedobacter sp.]
MKRILLVFVMLYALGATAQEIKIRGNVSTADNASLLSAASINVKDKVVGTTANSKGDFTLNYNGKLPITLIISAVGFEPQEVEVSSAGQSVSVSLVAKPIMLNEVVSSASRVNQSILESPVSIEKMSQREIKENPSLTFYDGLANLKGMEAVTSSITYKQVNTRGFATTGNSRFLQLVDGVDNQTPGLNFAIGNLFGASDIDIESAEVIPGAASALYGPVAFNGLLNLRTKDPFKYQGLSVQFKTGINHVDDAGVGARELKDIALRYAKAFNDRFAFKVNFSYLTGEDWHANDYTDVTPTVPVAQRGDNNPGRDALNIYGDESSRNLPGIGYVSRTGYAEKDLMNYGVYSMKVNGALHYRVSNNIEAIYQYNIGRGTASYTGSNRFSLNNFVLQTHRAELRGSNFFVRSYVVSENSHDSYNTRSLANFINRDWVRGLNGQLVAPGQADDTWFTRYTAAFNGTVAGVNGNNHGLARSFADQGRFLPGTSDFENAKNASIHKYGASGAGVFSNSKFYHTDGQYDFSSAVKFVELLAGGSYRNYKMFTNGSLFDDKENKIGVKEYGAFAQVGKKLLEDKLKLTASIRYDKNENFKGSFTPRFSGVYTVASTHNFRASYQTGFRNPTPVDQFIKLNAGPITILGGAPANSAGMDVYENSFTAASAEVFGPAVGAAIAGGATPQQAVGQNKDLLVKANVAYIKPEQQKAFEVGYKGLFANKLLVDLNYYRSTYTDFLLNTVVLKSTNPVLGADGKINPAAAGEVAARTVRPYQLYTNATDEVTAQGVSAGLTYLLGNFAVGANGTWSDFDLGKANINNIAQFNTPEYSTNVTFGNSNLINNFGFNAAWHWQSAFDWYGTFNGVRPGRINSYSMVDLQINKKIPSVNTTIKLGGSNIFNKYISQAYGSPAVGAIYYISLVFDSPLK